MIAGIVIGVVAALLANEVCEFSPWCARKLVRWSAFRRYADPGRAEMRAEELAALINNRPGNLPKLITAIGFVGAAVIVSARRGNAQESETGPVPLPAPRAMSHAEALGLIPDYLDGRLDELECARLRLHIDECGTCRREYGLEEAVRRLVEKHNGCDPRADLRAKVLVRIREIRATIELAE